jgi:hypothetical protein
MYACMVFGSRLPIGVSHPFAYSSTPVAVSGAAKKGFLKAVINCTNHLEFIGLQSHVYEVM